MEKIDQRKVWEKQYLQNVEKGGKSKISKKQRKEADPGKGSFSKEKLVWLFPEKGHSSVIPYIIHIVGALGQLGTRTAKVLKQKYTIMYRKIIYLKKI